MEPIPPAVEVQGPNHWTAREFPIDIFYFILNFYFYFILLYNTVLVLPYIDMNPPRVGLALFIWKGKKMNF